MRALYRNLLATTLCVAVSVFMFDGVGQANGGSSGPKKVKIDVRAELEPFDASSEPDPEGRARHHKEIRKGVIKKDEFKAMVKIPVPAPGLGITDETTAENADIRLVLSGAGVGSVECLLEFDEIEEDDDDDELQAVFKIHVRMKKGELREKKGMCIMTGGSHVVPNAQDGDTATATVNGTPFLEGTFEQHH